MVSWLKHNEERFRALGLFNPENGNGQELITAFSSLRGDTKKQNWALVVHSRRRDNLKLRQAERAYKTLSKL